MQEELDMDLLKLPLKKKPIPYKWVFKCKEEILGVEDAWFNAQLVARGFSQFPMIDRAETTFRHGELQENIYTEQSSRVTENI